MSAGVRLESAASRALRALGVSGRRLVARGGGWAVIGRDARRRPSVMLRESEALALVAAELVIAAEGGGYVLAQDVAEGIAVAAPVAAGAAAGWCAALAQAEEARGKTAADFAALVKLSQCGEGPLSLRAAMAGLRVAREAEAASRRGGLTMNWSATPMDRRRARGGRDGVGEAAREAALWLERLAVASPAPGFAFVQAACVEGRKLRVLEQRFALKPRDGAAVLARLLEIAADVFDGR